MNHIEEKIKAIQSRGAYIHFGVYADGRRYTSVGLAKKKIYFQVEEKGRSLDTIVSECLLLLIEEMEKKNEK